MSATENELDEPSPVPPGMSATETISMPGSIACMRSASRKIGCWTSSRRSTSSRAGVFQVVLAGVEERVDDDEAVLGDCAGQHGATLLR